MPIWKKIVFALVACFLFFLTLELVLWLAGAQTRLQREDPFRGFSGLVTIFERDGQVYRTRQDRYATFNRQSFAAQKPANGMRIFCLGGSSAFGFPWGAELAFTSIVGDVLQQSHPQLAIEAINLGAMSYAMHRLRIVTNEIINYQGDILIIYSGHNEFVEPAFYESLKRRSATRNRFELALSHSRIYSGLHGMVHKENHERPEQFVKRDNTAMYSAAKKLEIVEKFRTNLEYIVRLAHRHDIKVVLLTVPCNLREWKPESSTITETIRDEQQLQRTTLYQSGRQHLKATRHRPAAKDLSEAAAIAPSHAETHYRLGQAYEGLAQWSLARAAYQTACDSDAKPTRRLSAINRAIREVAAQERAILVDADKIFEHESEHGLVGFNLIEDYVHPNQKGHQLIAWHVWRAIETARWLGEPAPASREMFAKVAANRKVTAPKQEAAWLYNQGVLLVHQGRSTQAIEKFRQTLEILPDYESALYNLGAMLSNTHQYEEALEVIQKLMRTNPDHVYGHSVLAITLQKLGQPEEALDHFRKALDAKPDFVAARYNLANTLASLKRYDEAIGELQLALKSDPQDRKLHTAMGRIFLLQGLTDKAIESFEIAIRLDGESTTAHFLMGRALLAIGEDDRAEAQLRRVLQLNADDAQARALLEEIENRRVEQR